jgi:hypothetical protein
MNHSIQSHFNIHYYLYWICLFIISMISNKDMLLFNLIRALIVLLGIEIIYRTIHFTNLIHIISYVIICFICIYIGIIIGILFTFMLLNDKYK